ncbi:MAG: ECF transporter S component, partial [Clostridia bacterium]|nr:ECF transporter S component [Clostridia bacterium]
MASPKTQQTGSTSMVRKLTTTAVMAAIATILMYIEFPIPVMPAFVKLDFSELPALLTSFALGPWYGALVCLLKNLIHLPVTSSSGVGELANFLIGIFFVIPAG